MGEGTGSRPLITPNLPRQKRDRVGSGAGTSEETFPLAGRGQVSPLNSRASALLGITAHLPTPLPVAWTESQGGGGAAGGRAQLPCPHLCPAVEAETPMGEKAGAQGGRAGPPPQQHPHCPYICPSQTPEEVWRNVAGPEGAPSLSPQLHLPPSPGQVHRPLLARPQALWTRRSPSSQGPQRCRAARG